MFEIFDDHNSSPTRILKILWKITARREADFKLPGSRWGGRRLDKES
jgi:hypothetical protein